jgi:AcrR family transcriptional regulator
MSIYSKKLDPRVARTREMLRNALMLLIPEMGYNAISVQDITDKAGLNRATFYLHYHDKDDLLKQIIQSALAELGNLVEPHDVAASEPMNVSQIFIRTFEHVAAHAAFYRVMLQEPSVAPYLQQMQQHIEAIGMRAMSASHSQQTMLTPPDLYIAFIGWAYLGVIKWWVLNGGSHSSEYMAAQFIRLTMSGVHREFGVTEVIASLEDQLKYGST